MTLEEAIVEIDKILNINLNYCTPHRRKALNVAKEALREVQGLRETILRGVWILLPGETKE